MEGVINMEEIENRMVVDSEWERLENEHDYDKEWNERTEYEDHLLDEMEGK